jgi:FdhD protein
MSGERDDITRKVSCTKVVGGRIILEEDPVPIEEPVAVILNGVHAMDVTISPDNLREFLVGHLLTDGRIESISDVEGIRVGDGWIEAEFLEKEGVPRLKETIFSACFGDAPRRPGKITKIMSDLAVTPEHIQGAVSRVLASSAHGTTGGVHTAGLFGKDSDGLIVVSLCDDIGRHNALDKAIGSAALAGNDMASLFAATTGRGSSEMVAKCYQAGIPVMVSRGATTTLAIELARSAGITLVGFARGERLNVYCNGGRIEASG